MERVLILCAILFFSCSNSDALRFIRKRSADESHGSHSEKHWGYRNQDKSILPTNWHESHPKCYGKQQSPINIESHETVYDSTLAPLVITSEFKNDSAQQIREVWTIKNNGHSGTIYKIVLPCKTFF